MGVMSQHQEPNSLNVSPGVVVEKSITDKRLPAATRAGRTPTSHTHVLLQQLALEASRTTTAAPPRYLVKRLLDSIDPVKIWTVAFENTAPKKPFNV